MLVCCALPHPLLPSPPLHSALMNNADSAGWQLLTFSLLSTCQPVGDCHSGSAELGPPPTTANVCPTVSHTLYPRCLKTSDIIYVQYVLNMVENISTLKYPDTPFPGPVLQLHCLKKKNNHNISCCRPCIVIHIVCVCVCS